MQQRILTGTTSLDDATFDPKTEQPIKLLAFKENKWVEEKDGKKSVYVKYDDNNLIIRNRKRFYVSPVDESEMHVISYRTLHVGYQQKKIIRVNDNGEPIDANGKQLDVSEMAKNVIKLNDAPVLYDPDDTTRFRTTGRGGHSVQYYIDQGTEVRIKLIGNIKKNKAQKRKRDEINQHLGLEKTQQSNYTSIPQTPRVETVSENQCPTAVECTNIQAQPNDEAQTKEAIALETPVPIENKHVDNNNCNNNSNTQVSITTTTDITKAMYCAQTRRPVKHFEQNGKEWVEAKKGESPLYVSYHDNPLEYKQGRYYYTLPNGSKIHVQNRSGYRATLTHNQIVRVNDNGDPLNATGQEIDVSEIENHIITKAGQPVVYDVHNTELFRTTGSNGNIVRYYLNEGTEQRIRTIANIKNAEREKNKTRDKKLKLADSKLEQTLTERSIQEIIQRSTHSPFLFQLPVTQTVTENGSRTSTEAVQVTPGNEKTTDEVNALLMLASMGEQNTNNNNCNNNSKPVSNDQNKELLNPTDLNNTQPTFKF